MNSSHQFRRVFKYGAHARVHGVTLFYLHSSHPCCDTSISGVGIVVPKKYAQQAVHRNKAKRRIRHIVMHMIDEGELAPSDIIVCRLDKQARHLTYPELLHSYHLAYGQARDYYRRHHTSRGVSSHTRQRRCHV